MQSTFSKHLDNLRESGSYRQFRPIAPQARCYAEYNGRKMVNMTSNDYLGIANDTILLRKFYSQLTEENILQDFSLGAASSRLLTGDRRVSHELENRLTEHYRRQACLTFNSGYHANIGILPALSSKKDLILSDKLNHASIIDGIRLSRASFKRYRHKDYEHLSSLLSRHRSEFDRVIIVTESVFSMDGDVVDLEKLIDIKYRYDCLLYVDEAHAVGVYGKNGLGKAEESGVINEIDLLIGTFGKAFASVGAYCICEREIYDYLVNYSRPLIFTTALPPVVVGWNSFVLEEISAMQETRSRLARLCNRFRQSLHQNGFDCPGSTNIIPVIIGNNAKTVTLAEKMQNAGYLIFAVRPPTVPEGTSRFRLSLTASMDWQDIGELPEIMRRELDRA